MMVEYTDYVLCSHDGRTKPYLFYAPAFTHLKEGDLVVVETSKGEQVANVIASVSLAEGDEMIDFIIKATGAKELRPIVSKIIYHKYKYKEENNE